jgi:TfoX/Sxy family transcriptional regulator of competence genes
MSTSQSTIDYLLDQLSGLPSVRALKMFGEYALYCDEKIVALVCDNRLFLKITPAGKALVGEHYEEGPAYRGAKPSMVIGAEELDDGERLCELIRVTADALPAPRPKKPKTAKTAKTAKSLSKPKKPKKPGKRKTSK